MEYTDKEIEYLLKQLSIPELTKLMHPKKAASKKKRIQFPMIKAESSVAAPRMCISLKEAKAFLCEILLYDLDICSTAAIKAHFVEGFSTMAELMDDPVLKDNLLKTAARAVIMDRDNLLKYIVAVVTSI